MYSGINYLACVRKKNEIIENYSVILSYTTVLCEYRKHHLMWFSCFALLYSFMHWKRYY